MPAQDVQQMLQENERKDLLRFVTCGSVDDGKSTLIGRLLMESKAIYEDQLESIEQASSRWGTTGDRPDLALLTDGLKAEREQGITIDVAYRYFSTPKRKFIIADSPGHEQYTRNMATGASTADLAVILIDASAGVVTQSKRHAFITALLGIPHIVVAVNKMDLVDYRQEAFEAIHREFSNFAARLQIGDMTFVPISALEGANVVERSDRTPWYTGRTLLDHLENVHIGSDRNLIDLRLPVQYVCRPDRTFRGYQGTVASGTVKPGDEIMVLPSGMGSVVKAVLGPGGQPLEEGVPPQAVTVTLRDEIDISRGDMLVHPHNVPSLERDIDAMVVWMNARRLEIGRRYLIKLSSRIVPAEASALRYQVNVNTLHRNDGDSLGLNEIGRVAFTLSKPVAFDAYRKNRSTGAFIIIDRVTNNTVGAGMILDREPNKLLVHPEKQVKTPRSSNVRAQSGTVTLSDRMARHAQKPATIWLEGLTGSGKSTLAYGLEKRLFDAGAACNVLDGANMRLGVCKDLGFSADERAENIRRASEVARLFNQAGHICICAFLTPNRADREIARQIIGKDRFLEVYLDCPIEICRTRDPEGLYEKAESGEIKLFPGVSAPFEIPATAHLVLPTGEIDVPQSLDRLMKMLAEHGYFPAKS
jgi:bifunctional enzyme CysN/CysC